MTITQDQIKKIAKNLCKLPAEEVKIINDIGEILNYVDLLNEVDTNGVEPTISVVKKDNVLRKDEQTQKQASPEELLACSPQKVIAEQIAIGNIMK
ncbi:Asp-tRNA(Asn)/Glu-tRNA(Gln) amidotransferase subunit GatC [Candidatus Gracilibacteria bacterium]|nr:Asp-tRNA(Asn)/Glu-tRNA(Gln) amidotransferase subunit GatC [Candidatus Gracilibacteria bacterium]NUJ99353.1 Asp-tRNA(Asn)/Glu-tRNA(Gln) amidotransferase subunit GatC [Candidatus Gracilibacteria bacterium]